MPVGPLNPPKPVNPVGLSQIVPPLPSATKKLFAGMFALFVSSAKIFLRVMTSVS
jgi:hypothetical protein